MGGNVGKKVTFKDRMGKAREQGKKAAKEIRLPDVGGVTAPGPPQSFKKGGPVKKTGLAKVHRGERVLTKSQAKKYRKPTKRKRY